MHVIDGTTIKINRGNSLPINLQILREDGSVYEFQVGDYVDFGVYEKKGMNKNALILKRINVEEPTDHVVFTLSREDTKIGELINKPKNYWYEVELNGEHTVIGYDDEGAKIFRLYPEGSEIPISVEEG